MSRTSRILTIGAFAATGALGSAPAAMAAALPVEPPLNRPDPGLPMEPGSYQLSPARAADPDGGLPWGLAHFRSHPSDAPQQELVCTALGRVQDDRLGMITIRNTFLPITPGGGPAACGKLEPEYGEYAYTGYQMQAAPVRVGVRCSEPAPSGSGGPCSIDAVRSIFSLSLGRGIVSGEIQDRRGGTWRALPDAGEGTFLVVRRGLFSDKATPTIRVRATICGPDARRDLAPLAKRISDCTLTIDYPNDVRPAKESAASRRARRAKQLDIPIRIVERSGTASYRRFTARLKIPITIQKYTEGYAYRLTGPAGPGCRARRTADTSWGPITSYVMTAGRTLPLPIVPLDRAPGVWCRGRYTISPLFVEGGLRTVSKTIGHATFTVR